ncbi:MAG: hypothetical protein VX694_13500, partial [Planctomycetota bacterium]|nr:hypothetical protein [Planctomycetota bacterium]
GASGREADRAGRNRFESLGRGFGFTVGHHGRTTRLSNGVCQSAVTGCLEAENAAAKEVGFGTFFREGLPNSSLGWFALFSAIHGVQGEKQAIRFGFASQFG